MRMLVVARVSQFSLRIDWRRGLHSRIASALWQKGVRIHAFSAVLEGKQEILRLTVDKAAVAKQTFMKHGWKASESSYSEER